MNNTPPSATPKRKYTSAMIAVIICAAIVAVAVSVAILNPGEGFDILPSLTGDIRSKVHYSDMEYVRPDTDALISDIEELTAMVIRGDSFTEQRSLYNRILIARKKLQTMTALANIRHSVNVTDDFYSNERYTLEQANDTISSKLEDLMDTIAHSSFKTNYERTFFGVGYFTDWISGISGNELTSLIEDENRLIAEYSKLMVNPCVEFNGKSIYLNSEEYKSLSDSDKSTVNDIYVQKYRASAGEIFVKLVKTRKQISAKYGLDYLTYVYREYGRDYSPEQIRDYLNGISASIIPVLDGIVDATPSEQQIDPSYLLYALSDATKKMGKTAKEAFDYMFDYGLYDISYSKVKSSRSYTYFLAEYEAPFMFLSPDSSINDYLTTAYEFGRFADAYYNRSMYSSDSHESAALAMAYLLPYYTNAFNTVSTDDIIDCVLAHNAMIYTRLAFISEFEHTLYELPDGDITLQRINEIASECAVKYRLNDGSENIFENWFEIAELFRAPLKNVGTLIANDTALQVLNAELRVPGSGIDSFIKIVDRDKDLSFIEDVIASGFAGPFTAGRHSDIADLLSSVITRNDSQHPENDRDPIETSSAPEGSSPSSAS